MILDNLKRYVNKIGTSSDPIVDHDGYGYIIEKDAYLAESLFYAATNDGEYLQRLFPQISDHDYQRVSGYDLKAGTQKPSAIDMIFKLNTDVVYSHPPNVICGREFKAKDLTYRCQQCGFDDTCVLCADCFNPDDHKGHSVYIYSSHGGGMCDCGDPESFTGLNCKCQLTAKNDTSRLIDIPSDFAQSLYNTIQFALDYIINVANIDAYTIPLIHDVLKDEPLKTKLFANSICFATDEYGEKVDQNLDDSWVLVLWNDEVHNYDETENIINSALQCGRNSAKSIAKTVDENGKMLIKQSSDIDSLFKIKKIIESIGLVTTISSFRDYKRSQISDELIKWLSLIMDNSMPPNFSELSRNYICQLLLQPNFKLFTSLPLDTLFNETLSASELYVKCYENSVLYNNHIPNVSKIQVKKDLLNEPIFYKTETILETCDVLDDSNLYRSRIQYLMIFEKRLCKNIRQILAKVLTDGVVSIMEKRNEFYDHFVEIFPILFTSMAKNDRELDHNFIDKTQFFLVPTRFLEPSSKFSNGGLGVILGPLINLIANDCSKYEPAIGYSVFNNASTNRVKPTLLQNAVFSQLNSTRHLLLLSQNLEMNLGSKDNLIILLTLFKYFQQFWGIERKYGDHVLHDIRDYMVHELYSIPVIEIARMAASYIAKQPNALDAILFIRDFLYQENMAMKAPGIAKFQVSKDKVSFINAINGFLSFTIESMGFQNCYDSLSICPKPFMHISDKSLRSFVFVAQVMSGFWVRNGTRVSEHAGFYTSKFNHLVFRDFHLMQITTIIDDPKATLYNILDRWELIPWFTNEVLPMETIYKEKFHVIILHFVAFLFNLITDRTFFDCGSQQERDRIKLKNLIMYLLCLEQRSYAWIRAIVKSADVDAEELDEVLDQVSDYIPPSGLSDTGMYKLKPKLFKSLNPISLYLEAPELLTALEKLTSEKAKRLGKIDGDVTLIPHLGSSNVPIVNEKIARFAKLKEFFQLIYKLFQVAIDTKDDTYIPQLLFLTHAIILDDEKLYGKEYLNEQFIKIPIGNLLLTLTESDMSPFITKQSKYLLSILISKDSNITECLNDAFGPEYVANYLHKTGESDDDEKNRKKRTNEERQKKIMKKFSRQRNVFLAKNESLKDLMTPDSESDQDKVRYCVLCMENEFAKTEFGLLASLSPSDFVCLPFESNLNHSKIAFQDWDHQSLRKSENEYGEGFSWKTEKNVFNNNHNKKIWNSITTCGHGMHRECFNQYSRQFNINYIQCPLCKSFFQMLLPSPLNQEKSQVSLKLEDSPIHTKYNQITRSYGSEKCRNLVDHFVNAQQLEDSIKSLRFSCKQISSSSDDTNELILVMQGVSNIVASTIGMHELATRLEGGGAYSKFLPIPSPAVTSIKSLILYGAMCFTYREQALIKFSRDLEGSFGRFWETLETPNIKNKVKFNGVLGEVIFLYLQTDESLKTISRFGYTKLFAITLYSLMGRAKKGGPTYANLYSSIGKTIDSSTIEKLKLLISENCPTFEGFDNDSFIQALYFSIEKCMLPYLRRLIIFKDSLTSVLVSENEFKSDSEFESLEDDILGQAYEGCSDVLCEKLRLPTLKELISILSSEPQKEFELETSIFANVINAKIPKLYNDHILELEFPGVFKLLELPSDFNACLTGTLGTSLGYGLCLACGKTLLINPTAQVNHIQQCCSTSPIFFSPRDNIFTVLSASCNMTYGIPAPYLTEHGEVRKEGMTASLSEMRYKLINQLWLKKDLFKVTGRDARFFAAGNMGLENFIFDVEDDDLEDDEDEELIDID